ncbi:MAG: bifunctional pantoate--beta-alanine ligase/(d)CMP kinase [Limnothrix sp. CACIAM 69d]|nr:MAG: bifunctional pantoate--beta-alanine ligase/(d)CMP kinase [Limnothrix sp. CACIAM 69d]
MQVVKTVAALRCAMELFRSSAAGIAIGLVPTMGALHEGHRSLMTRARSQCGRVVVSIFVNPLQFGPQEDLERYPRNLATDLALCEAAGVDLVFVPTPAELGVAVDRAALTQVIPPDHLANVLCGRSRPGHFQGVTTIVTKLLNLVQPDLAFFGQKDAQQVAILRRLVADLNLPVELITCPIVRESDGLALSSRNQYLSASERQQALAIFQSLQGAIAQFQAGERSAAALLEPVRSTLSQAPGLSLDYAELVDPNSLTPLQTLEQAGLLAVAAQVGSARLIDNVILQTRRPVVAIDGPAGAGKSTVTRQVAQQLGLLYLDTGAMYRSVAWLALDRGLDPADRLAMAELSADCTIRFGEPVTPGGEQRVWINGQEVTSLIRTPTVTAQVSVVAAHPEVRRALVAQQRAIGRCGGLVAEGRDIGTHVFPEAEVKIFLTATPRERAKRRLQDWRDRGQSDLPDLDSLEAAITERDYQDSNRAVAPMVKAVDAWELVTDGMTIEQVVQAIVARVP